MVYNRDPIETSSPPRFGGEGDEYNTIPTQPLDRMSRSPHVAIPSEPFVTQPTQPLLPHTTQPTQPLTPGKNRMYNPTSSQVQVPRSSPAAERFSSPFANKSQSQSQNRPRIISAMAPPGTMARFPSAVPRPQTIDITSDDPPVAQDSDEEEWGGSNIPMSKLEQQRVQETPQKSSSFGFDLADKFAHNTNGKRPADAASSFPPAKRPAISQTGPSRAQAIDLTDEMTLEDIPDVNLRNKVKRLGDIYIKISVQDRLNALMSKKGNFDDTADFLATLPEKEEQRSAPKGTAVQRSSPEPMVTKATTAKRVLSKPSVSLQDRYAKTTSQPAAPTAESPQKPARKGKLMRGRRNRSTTPITLSSSPPPPPPRLQQKPNQRVPHEDDEGIIISDDDSDVQQEEEEVFHDDGELLDFFNNCTVEGMVDLSGHKAEDIRLIFEHRPFISLDKVEKLHVDSRKPDTGKKARKPKITFGERLVDAARAMWNAYTTIDEVVKKCEERGRPMVNGMARWGINIFGASTDGEIAATSLDDSDTGSNRDSGYQSPNTVGSDSDREDMRKVADRASGKRKLLKKPAIMNADVELKDYQVVGLNWLNLLWQNKISGILADDMGLGKTCQVIAFLSHLKESGAPGPHLIVVPGSTLENWAREFKHFAEEIDFQIYYGGQNERFQMQEEILDKIENGDIDVVLTTYDLCGRREDNSFLRKCKPQMAIFDEGHMLRSSNTKRYQDLMKIKAQVRLLLTGTPLQNSLQELASILAFLMPDIFEAEDVRESVAVVFKHKAKVNESDTHGTLLSTQRINRARSMMTPFVLRRKKAQVLKHLPKKTCRVEYCDLTPIQKKLYSEQLERQRKILVDRAAGLLPKETANVMMRLRQAAIHPLLFRERFTDDILRRMSKVLPKEDIFRESVPEYIYQDLEPYRDFEAHKLCLQYPRSIGKFALKNNEWLDSGKAQKLVELLRTFKANGDRALVFSQFTSVMDILEWVLDSEDIGYCRIDGSTPITERQQLLDVFYQDESIPVFMLSTKSGGAGINLACANKVVIFDSSFNPQDDIQAENRAHRVGQTREVEVVRLVTKGTVEEQIHALGVSKLELDKMVAGDEGEDKKGAKKGKKDDVALDAAEKQGLEAVEQMLLRQLEEEKGEKGDVKEQFMDGLKKAGLDMSAAE
ncbi:DNA-dependent ATPase fun30 [Didymosphaeria variabile]|uniref:DNA helicase n=1 Tax=Didymosphaeria variabile TaxID=1932322 RepID=A0A9W8XBN4_9PLEO|nr:DNA-dependent ATPase fun30 [Didymosphaeria variabile]KAJ4345580.1 DNA-dependent ATPase fun30 [Didymosphaeria variabile]